MKACPASPTILFNEKVLCGLGKGIALTGKMDEASVERALDALHRFKALSDQARAATMYVLATAAAREASQRTRLHPSGGNHPAAQGPRSLRRGRGEVLRARYRQRLL